MKGFRHRSEVFAYARSLAARDTDRAKRRVEGQAPHTAYAGGRAEYAARARHVESAQVVLFVDRVAELHRDFGADGERGEHILARRAGLFALSDCRSEHGCRRMKSSGVICVVV